MKAIEIKNISKIYKLGELGTKTFAESIKSLFTKKKKLVYSKNDRSAVIKGETHVSALNKLNLTINSGEVVGIIGKNGAGKSTLLKLLSRITTPSTGEILINGRVGALLEVGTGFQPDLTGRENIYLNGAILGMTKKEIDDKIDEIIAFSGCAKYIDTPVKRYSSGMNVRLGFSVAAHLEPEILIIDEVLAVGDQEFQDQCVKKMKEFALKGKTVLFVSHNMASVKGLCNRGIVLSKGEVGFDGLVDDAIQYYLTQQEKIDQSGVIGKNKGEIKNSETYFAYFSLAGCTKEVKNHILYGENIKIDFIVESTIEKEINIEFLVHSQDNYAIANCCNTFDNYSIGLKSGENTFSFEFENIFAPGNYSLTLAIAEPSGKTLHYLPNYINFKIDVVPLNAEKKYPFVWVNSPVILNGKWSNS